MAPKEEAYLVGPEERIWGREKEVSTGLEVEFHMCCFLGHRNVRTFPSHAWSCAKVLRPTDKLAMLPDLKKL